jgi:5-formyltetrahydrofolate cyclo-ligase
MPKKSIRDEMLGRRKALAATTCLGLSLRIQARLLASPEFAASDHLALYSPVMNEVFTEEIFSVSLRLGKKVAYPRVCEETLEFVEVEDRSELCPGAYGILEPRGSRVISLASLDLLLVPGVVFDTAGHRLGYGKGFYDRVLHRRAGHALLVGLCFEQQLIRTLPAETHDVRMDMIITEERTLGFGDLPVEEPKLINTRGGGPELWR